MIASVQLVQTIGLLVNGRIYPLRIDENEDSAPPYIIYQEVSSQPEITDDGITGHEWTRMQIDVYHPDKYKVRLLANKVVNTINDQIKPSIYDGQQQMYDASSELYRQSIDYEFWQTTPTE
ncbi:tail completion protein gp17 [Psychrobacter sp. MES7-P7E]|uniref:tail completion protein gp17 n=1 Tax=Psychrobacter sp. MES7-P7E TaxID=2058322 RepID=UPI000C7BC66A|nr:DUF3168 domain-containing protein [Psychrobacter sp. MES7-P7E]PLT23760.1 hypothetical protein CXF62_00315 [Psychrobacter sp. MES7-P7E]